MRNSATKRLRSAAVAQGAPTPVGGPEDLSITTVMVTPGNRTVASGFPMFSPEDPLRAALRDLLDLYDRHVHGKKSRAHSAESWGVDEVLRLNAIRELAK